MAFNIVLNLIFFFFYLNIEHLKFNKKKFLWQFFNRRIFKQRIFCSEFFDCKYPVFKNTASGFQAEEEIRNIKFNI